MFGAFVLKAGRKAPQFLKIDNRTKSPAFLQK